VAGDAAPMTMVEWPEMTRPIATQP